MGAVKKLQTIEFLANRNIIVEEKIEELDTLYKGLNETDDVPDDAEDGFDDRYRFLHTCCAISEPVIGEHNMPQWWHRIKHQREGLTII